MEADLDYPKGSFKNPLTKEELYSKFGNLAACVFPADRCRQVIGAVEGVDRMQNMSELVSLLIK